MTRSTSRGRARVTVDPFPKRPRAAEKRNRRQRASTLLTVNSDDDDEGGERKRYCCWKTSRLFPPKDVFLEQHCRADLLSVCDSETRGGDLRVEVMFNLECGSCPVEAARARCCARLEDVGACRRTSRRRTGC